MFTAPTERDNYVDGVVAVGFEGLGTTGHPAGECTWCGSGIEEGTRYVVWNILEHICTECDGEVGIEFLCMECDWKIRERIASNKIAYIIPDPTL
jgi:hypothetical protein